MNDATLFSLRSKIIVGEKKRTCYGCGGTLRSPYRYRLFGKWHYCLLPCYKCQLSKLEAELKKYPPVEETDRWVNVSEVVPQSRPEGLEQVQEPAEDRVPDRLDEPEQDSLDLVP